MKTLKSLGIGLGLVLASTVVPVSAGEQQFKTLGPIPAAEMQQDEMAATQGSGLQDVLNASMLAPLILGGQANQTLLIAAQGVNESSRMLCKYFGLSCSAPTTPKVVPAKAPKPTGLNIPQGARLGRPGSPTPSQLSYKLSQPSG
jgi:hypothetical protein